MSLLTPPRITGSSVRPGDRNFRFITTGAGITVLVVLAAIAAFLIWSRYQPYRTTPETSSPINSGYPMLIHRHGESPF